MTFLLGLHPIEVKKKMRNKTVPISLFSPGSETHQSASCHPPALELRDTTESCRFHLLQTELHPMEEASGHHAHTRPRAVLHASKKTQTRPSLSPSSIPERKAGSNTLRDQCKMLTMLNPSSFRPQRHHLSGPFRGTGTWVVTVQLVPSAPAPLIILHSTAKTTVL